MSYQRERGEAIAQLTRHGMPYHTIETLLRAATTINRLAELACSSEAADRDRIKCPAMPTRTNPKPKGPCLCDGQWIDQFPQGGGVAEKVYQHADIPRITLQDWQAEQRVQRAIDALNKDLARLPSGMVAEGVAKWSIVTSGDPRGYTLRVVPPAYAEENKTRSEHDPRTIGIPPGPSRLRW